MRASRGGLAVLGWAIGTGAAFGEPKPTVTPAAWALRFTYHDPQSIHLRLPGDPYESTFWYVLYSVTNDSGEEVLFYPTFDIVAEDLSVVEGGANISPSVYEAIKARHRKTHPFFVNPSEVYGPLPQGEDHARSSAIAFRLPAPGVNHFTLYVGGLSGDIVKTRNLRFNREAGECPANLQFFTLRKTLAVSYELPGDATTRAAGRPKRVKEEWVMR